MRRPRTRGRWPTPSVRDRASRTPSRSTASRRSSPRPPDDVLGGGFQARVQATSRACLLPPGPSLADAWAPVVTPPAEAGLMWLRLERRARKVVRRELQVVPHGGEVVRTIGME